MAVVSASKNYSYSYKWYMLNRNQLICVYILLIYLTITFLILHEFEFIFYLIPVILIILLVKLTWEQSNQTLSTLGLFVLGFLLFTFVLRALETKQQRELQLMYNYEQFKNLNELNPKIENRTTGLSYNMFFVETNPNRGKLASNGW